MPWRRILVLRLLATLGAAALAAGCSGGAPQTQAPPPAEPTPPPTDPGTPDPPPDQPPAPTPDPDPLPDPDPVAAYLIGGSVSGLGAQRAVVLRDGAGGTVSVTADGAFAFSSRVRAGTAYDVAVVSHPTDQACAIRNGRGVVGGDVADVEVACSTVVVQRWSAPTSWGGRWEWTPSMVQHAWFDGSGIVEDPLSAVRWTLVGAAPPLRQLAGLPTGTRWGAGPFTGQSYRAQGGSDDAVRALTRDLLVCAIVAPDYDPRADVDGQEREIISHGTSAREATDSNPGGGWVLHQMHEQFCFHYQYTAPSCANAGNSCMRMVHMPTHFAYDRDVWPANGPLNPSYLVYCAGRDGNTVRAGVNGIESVAAASIPADAALDAGAVPIPTSIGGYVTDLVDHAFGGRIYETAIWSEPATLANMQAKFAAFQGLVAGARYSRNREGAFIDLDGRLHFTWRHGPRIDPAKGMLFGLQGWNRLSAARRYPADPAATQHPYHPFDIATPGEDLSVPSWTRTLGASVDASPAASIEPPGDKGRPTAHRLTLPPGASLSAELQPFDSPGPIQGVMWLRPVSRSGQLVVATNQSSVTLDLARHGAGEWTAVSLSGLATNAGLPTAGSLSLRAPAANADAIELYAWGIALTQVGGGGDLGSFDPGAFVYDWSAGKDVDTWGLASPGADPAMDPAFAQDALQLAPVPAGTGGNGYCLSATARPFDGANPPLTGLAWNAGMRHSRTALAWVSDAAVLAPATPRSARLYVSGLEDAAARQLCFGDPGANPLCAPAPADWPAGSQHTLTGCVSRTGEARLFADGVRIAGPMDGAAVLDLSSGHLVVGNGTPDAAWGLAASGPPADISRPWHGFVAKVVACRDLPDELVAACR